MLIYHPAYDGYHCIFRLAALISRCPSMEVDKARILDFYLCFPSCVASMHLPRELTWAKSMLRSMENKYRDPVNAQRTFLDLREFQLSALASLAAAQIIDTPALQSGQVAVTAHGIPAELKELCEQFLEDNSVVTRFIVSNLANTPLTGPSGLKARSGLLEYRYDIV